MNGRRANWEQQWSQMKEETIWNNPTRNSYVKTQKLLHQLPKLIIGFCYWSYYFRNGETTERRKTAESGKLSPHWREKPWEIKWQLLYICQIHKTLHIEVTDRTDSLLSRSLLRIKIMPQTICNTYCHSCKNTRNVHTYHNLNQVTKPLLLLK